MTLAQYLEDNRHEAVRWPGGRGDVEDVAPVPGGLPGREFKGAAREVLLHCYAVLAELVQQAADAELRVEAAWCLAEVATALRTISDEGP